MKIYNHSVLGGTFDNLHKGHKFFIKKAFDASNKVTIGLTSDEFLKKVKLDKNIQSFVVRQKRLEQFLSQNNLLKKANIIPIQDIYGSTLDKKNIDTIFVTMDTLDNAEKINHEREKKGFKSLKIEIVDLVNDDQKKTISSTNIRKGDINDLGNYYKKYFIRDLKLVDKYRDDFKKPIGDVADEINSKDFKNKFIIAVGDVAVAKLISIGITPNISIYDLFTKREKVKKEVEIYLPKPDFVLTNRQGTIDSKTTQKINKLIKKSYKNNKKYSIRIIGEEDLIAIPAVLLSPIGSIVFYGLRNVGGIIVKINLTKKKHIENDFLPKFEKL